MAKPRTDGVLRRFRRLLTPVQAAARGDAQLLDRFAGSGDEAAFELLVWRHRQLVMGVCRRVLGDYHDAEDAFQATFLTLARKASSISRRECLVSWLYRVSYRIALSARSRRRTSPTSDLTTIPSTHDPIRDADRHDLRVILDDVVSRLPAVYRAAVVLCYLQGKTYRETGAELGLPLGTVSAHLSRARAMLREALARRGVVVPAATLTSVLCGHAAVEAASAAVVDQTVRAVQAGPPGGTQAAVLLQGVLRAMAIEKLKTVGVVSVAILLVTTVVGAIVHHLAPATDCAQPDPVMSQAAEPAHRVDQTTEDQRPKPPSLADRYRALLAGEKADIARWNTELEATRTDADRTAIRPSDDEGWAKKMWALVVEDPHDPIILEVLCSIAVWHCWSDETPLGLDRLLRLGFRTYLGIEKP